jgi:hypothetical protein
VSYLQEQGGAVLFGTDSASQKGAEEEKVKSVILLVQLFATVQGQPNEGYVVLRFDTMKACLDAKAQLVTTPNFEWLVCVRDEGR